ncbi:putative colanic acid biosynthesis UDP-glucose lipid carrier transferase [Vreelandella songnenensis]|uniref:Putative colanic acid biosynthesis UDP-glucose lipid carrier transferase n=1 Tax=Vreelandella songnenensis TaxID=1176243 RepID=A0A2T0V840_9GAMM|nr:undecaprenyl-phosphate glucose phosphotransferase [Halomonas songnenensis]PRY66355.1 putative colanic acid biosynthesis UDP-glucose lipid carrier transferase [Halomonas songnenensis]
MDRRSIGIVERYPAQIIVPIVDIFSLLIAGMLAYFIRFQTFNLHDRYWLALVVMALLVLLINTNRGGYIRWRIVNFSTLLLNLGIVWIAVAILISSIIYFAHASGEYSRLWIGYTLFLSFIIAATLRVSAQLLLKYARKIGKAKRPVFLIGPSLQIVHVGKGMRDAPFEGYYIAGIERLRDKPDALFYERLIKRVIESGAREVWICVPLEMGGLVRSIFYELRYHTAEVRFIPDFEGMQLLNHRMSEVAGHLAVDLSVSPLDGVNRIVKRMEDLILGTLISILILPVCLVIALVIKLTSPGPVLFKQYRTGANGKFFKVYKFRTMYVHQEPDGWVTQASPGDERVTPVGAFLRKSSLDELPQFYNVLQGRMSIVGPRPHALAHNDYYKDIVESYMKRHKVKPGITGWAQVNGHRGGTDTIEKMEKRVAHDLWYIDSWTLGLDLRIIFLTVVKGFFHKNAY